MGLLQYLVQSLVQCLGQCLGQCVVQRLGRSTVLTAVLGLLIALPVSEASASWAAELTARQQQVLADAANYQTKFEAGMKLALDTAGPGEGVPAGSRGKLAMSRLQSAMQPVPTLESRFAELPGDDPAVKELRARFDATLADAKALEARLTGQSQPDAPAKQEAPAQQPGKPAKPAAAAGAGGAKLDYRQEDVLKGAKFNLNQVDGYANALDQLVEQANTTADKNALDHRKINSGVSTIAEAQRKLGFANDALAKLPADGRGVAEAAEQYNSLVARINAADAALGPVHAQLQKLIDVNSYPDFAADRERLAGLAQMFNGDLIQSNRPAAVEIVNTADAARGERNRIMEKYADFLKQDTEPGRQIAGSAVNFDSRYQAFAQQVGQWLQSAPAMIDGDIKQVNDMAATAVAEQKPAFFNGGIPQQLGYVEEKVNLYNAVDPAAARPYMEKLAALRADLKNQQAQLSEGIITANTLPPDRYTGSDRAAMEAMAIERWKSVQPDAQVLKVCFHSDQWNRETKWEASNTAWYKIDRSKIQAQLIIKHDDRLAVMRPVNLWIDHVNNDKRTATNFDDITDELQPNRFLLLDKVK